MEPKKDERKPGMAPVPPIKVKGKEDALSGKPMFRAPGFVNRSGLAGRLKGLKSRDIAFIVAGLAVLIMAPIAEFVLSSSDDGSGTLRQGFDQKGDFFTGAGSPYEDGLGGIAPGGLPGRAGDVITPLNVRDPITLIMGPGGDSKPIEAPRDAVKSPEPKTDPGWKEAVRAAKRGVSEVVKKASLPRPSVKLAGKLNWLSSFSGGGHGAGVSLAAPTSQGLLSAPRAGSHLSQVQAAPGYRGADRRGIATGGAGSGSLFDGRRTGAAGGPGGFSLDGLPSGTGANAASGLSFGSPGTDTAAKSPGNNAQEGSKNVGIKEKEDLAHLARKMNMEKAIDLKWAKKRYDQLERKKMIEQTLLQTAQQAFLKILDKLLEGAKGGGKDEKGKGSPPPGGPGGPGGPSGPSGPGPQVPEGSKPGTIQRPPRQAFEIGGSGRGQPKDAEAERSYAVALFEGGTKGMEKGSRAVAPEWKAEAQVKAAAAAEPEVDKIKPYTTSAIQAALGEVSQIKPPPDRPIGDKGKVTAGVNFGKSKEGQRSLEETERLAKEAIAAFQKANKSAQDYAKVVKSSADEFAKGLPKVSEHDKRLEEHKNSLKQARPELDGQVKTTLAQLNKDWQAAKTDDDKDAVVKKAETAIETYMGKVRPPHSAVNQTHAGVSAAADDARKQVASMRQTTTAGYDSVRKSYADFQVKLMALAAAAGKIDPQGGQKTATPDANLATLKRQASELVRTLAEHYKSLAGEIPPIVSADAKLNDAGDAMEKIYAK